MHHSVYKRDAILEAGLIQAHTLLDISLFCVTVEVGVQIRWVILIYLPNMMW
jgi:hypothetical protein